MRFVTLAVLFLLAAACAEERNESTGDVLLASDPPSLVAGDSVVATITASEAFFEGDISGVLVSVGGLTIDSLDVIDDVTALASLVSTDQTQVGIHSFEIAMGDRTGLLEISVIVEDPGPGTITYDGNTATAGADNAVVTILGDGTAFDELCTVEVQGADGIEVTLLNVINQTWVEIRYDISLDQEPAMATLVLRDGAYSWDIPFSILSPTVYENSFSNSTLEKGQVADVTIGHTNSNVGLGTIFWDLPAGIEVGTPVPVLDGEITVPVRVAYDYEGSSVSLRTRTMNDGNAMVEFVDLTLQLAEPSYLVVTPSRLTVSAGTQEVTLSSVGLDLMAVDSLTLDGGADFSLSSWQADSPSSGTATFVMAGDALPGLCDLVADDGSRQVQTAILLEGYVPELFEAWNVIPDGDSLFVPVFMTGSNFVASGLDAIGGEQVIARGITFVDAGCVVLELETLPGAYSESGGNDHSVTIYSGANEYNAQFYLVDSGL